MDTNLFFPVRGSSDDCDETVNRQIEYAKTICNSCPVIKECRDYILEEGLRYENDFGIWGGMTPQERHQELFEIRNMRQRERRKAKLRCKTQHS